MTQESAGREVSRGTFEIIAGFLHAKAGIVLTQNKLYLLESRLRPVGARHGIDTLAELAARMMGRGAAAQALAGDVLEAMTTNETFFFRDGKPFTHLREVALPALNAARPPGQALRIWSAASSSGQEAYSIAMTVAELGALAGRSVEVLGTDLSREQVERGRQGLYSHFEVQRGLPIQMLVQHFDREGKSWRVKSALRGRVAFREWNLLDDPEPLGTFDVVFCRNVLIYFDEPTKSRVLRQISQRMARDGYLYLGGAETVVGLRTPFVAQPGATALRLWAPHDDAAAPWKAARQRPETIRSTS